MQDNKTINTRRGECENKEPHFTGFLSRKSSHKQSVIFPIEDLKIKKKAILEGNFDPFEKKWKMAMGSKYVMSLKWNNGKITISLSSV